MKIRPGDKEREVLGRGGAWQQKPDGEGLAGLSKKSEFYVSPQEAGGMVQPGSGRAVGERQCCRDICILLLPSNETLI